MIKTKTKGEGEVLLTWTPSCADLKLIRISLVNLSAAFAITVFTPKGSERRRRRKKEVAKETTAKLLPILPFPTTMLRRGEHAGINLMKRSNPMT
jgi:hypothetical protein